jgi:pyruvate/oxaloacetate carboxyltransferase
MLNRAENAKTIFLGKRSHCLMQHRDLSPLHTLSAQNTVCGESNCSAAECIGGVKFGGKIKYTKKKTWEAVRSLRRTIRLKTHMRVFYYPTALIPLMKTL